MLLLAATVAVGRPVCCAFGDCCPAAQERAAQEAARTRSCSCCKNKKKQQEPQPVAPATPPCDCHDHHAKISTPDRGHVFASLELVAIVVPVEVCTVPAVVRTTAPESTVPPIHAQPALNLPLLL
jgi:hypothetical protein